MLVAAPTRPTTRAWAVLAAVLMTAGLMVAVTPAPSQAAASDLYSAVNASRASAGVPALVRDSRLDAVAQAWTQKMASSDDLSHNPSYSSQIPSGWTAAGENVGYAYSDSQLHQAWMNSSGHKANVLSTKYNSVGIGYVRTSSGKIWGTHVFANYPGAQAPAPAAPPVPYARVDHTSDARSDVVARTDGGDLYVYPGTGRGGLSRSIKAGYGWNSMTALMSVRDANGDSRADVYSRDTSGKLWLYPGNGRAGFGGRSQVGSGWNGMSMLLSAGDTNRDGKADLYARDASGRLLMYPGNGKGGFGRFLVAGTGWNNMVEIVSTGDVTGDRVSDVYARDRSGRLWFYRGNGKGGLTSGGQAGHGWGSMVEMAGPGDLTGDGLGDLIATDRSGRMLMYAAAGPGRFRSAAVIGSGWQGMNAIG